MVESILKQFSNLDAYKRDLLIRNLSSRERRGIVRIVKKNKAAGINSKICKKLLDNIEKVKGLDYKITRKESPNSPLSRLKRRFIRFIGDFLNLFHFLTAEKTMRLIKKLILQKQDKGLPAPSEKRLIGFIEKAKKASPDEKVNLTEILIEHGFSTKIESMIFSQKFSLNNTNLEGITFTDCTFQWTQCNNSSLNDVTFNNCSIYNLALMSSELENCRFESCDMREVMFSGANLDNVIFEKSAIISSSFEDASLESCQFIRAALPATHFFEATVTDSQVVKSNLKDTVFFGTLDQFSIDEQTMETAVVTRPIVAILIVPSSCGITTPKAFIKLDQSVHTIGLRITTKAQKTNKDKVNNEVEEALAAIGPYRKSQPPIPQRLIQQLAKDTDSETAKILKKAEMLAKGVDAFFLPGGEDLPPALYGKEEDAETEWEDDYRRSILELGIIHQSFNKGVPLMGVCRGFQMANVYFGAKLQNKKKYEGLQRVKKSTQEARGLYAEAMKRTIYSFVGHHQAIPKKDAATEHLETAVLNRGFVKATELKESGAVPMILLQFHPEYHHAYTAQNIKEEFSYRYVNMIMSRENKVFWNILAGSVNAYHNKSKVLEQLKSKVNTII